MNPSHSICKAFPLRNNTMRALHTALIESMMSLNRDLRKSFSPVLCSEQDQLKNGLLRLYPDEF